MTDSARQPVKDFNMLQLTPKQQETLYALERSSFDGYCKRTGKDAETYSALISEALIHELNTVRTTAGDELPASLSEHFRNAVESRDMIARIKVVEDHANAVRLSHIVGGAPRHLINYMYLSSLADTLQLSAPSPANDDALHVMLKSLPLRLMWENNFDAFVTHETLLDDIPCVCVFHTITSGLKALAQLVATAAVQIGNPLPIII
jgi:hypothetical protein